MCCRITENVWKNSGFLRSKKGLLCTPDLVCSFFKFISHIFQRESDKKYIQLATIRFSWLCSPIQTFDFPTILSQLPMPLQLWRVLWKAFMISIAALQAATILVAMASEKKNGDWIIGESRHLAIKGYKLKRIKLTSRFTAF